MEFQFTVLCLVVFELLTKAKLLKNKESESVNIRAIFVYSICCLTSYALTLAICTLKYCFVISQLISLTGNKRNPLPGSEIAKLCLENALKTLRNFQKSEIQLFAQFINAQKISERLTKFSLFALQQFPITEHGIET